MSDDKIMQALGMLASEVSEGGAIIDLNANLPEVHVPQEPTSVAADYEFAKKNIYKAIGRGNYALEQLLHIAVQSQHPRAFEVFSTLMKTLVDSNKELIKLTAERNDAEGNGTPEVEVTNNNLVMTTDALQDMILRMQHKSDGR